MFTEEEYNRDLTFEKCVDYAMEHCEGYYTREKIEECWTYDKDAVGREAGEEFFANYSSLKHEDERAYPCKCGKSTVYAHPKFGVTFGFGPAGACTCDGEADLSKEPIKTT